MQTNVKKEKRVLKVGVLGCGIISQAAHLEACMKARNIQLEAICDISDELREKMNNIYEPKKMYKDYMAMLSDGEIDAVIIGVGDQFHVACAKKAIEKKKHIFVEKPLGVSVEECLNLKTAAKERGVIVQVGNMKRFDGGLQFAKKFVENDIGDVTTYKGWYCDSIGRYVMTDNVMPVLYQSNQMKKPFGNPKTQLERYYLLGHGSHLFDTARYFMGKIESVDAKYINRGRVHSWLIGCNFASGAIGNLDLTIAIAQDWHEGLEIYGTEGSVFANIYNPWEFRSAKVQCCDKHSYMIQTPYVPDGQFYRRQLEAFADVVMYGIEQTGANIEDGIEAIRALVATYESVHQGGRRVYLKNQKGGL